MANSYAISALTAQRAKISSLIIELERKLVENHRASLLHIDCTFKLLDPTIKIHVIWTLGPTPKRSDYFGPGEITERCLNAVRTGGPNGCTVEDVALKAMADKGVSGDEAIRTDFIKRFH